MPPPDGFAEAIAAARALWGIEVDPERLQRYVTSRRDAGATGLRLMDLCLACGCANQDPKAIAAFDRELVSLIESAIRQVGGGRVDADEVAQRLRTRLLVGDGQVGPAITDYGGRGPLLGWLRIVATREILMMRRREKFEAPLDEEAMAELPALGGGPELDFLNRHYRAAFRTAFQRAFAELEPLARDMIRAHYLEGVMFDALGERHQIHRATAARWVARARQSLVEKTREHLSRTLDVSEAELDSILQLVGSHFEITLRTQVSAAT